MYSYSFFYKKKYRFWGIFKKKGFGMGLKFRKIHCFFFGKNRDGKKLRSLWCWLKHPMDARKCPLCTPCCPIVSKIYQKNTTINGVLVILKTRIWASFCFWGSIKCITASRKALKKFSWKWWKICPKTWLNDPQGQPRSFNQDLLWNFQKIATEFNNFVPVSFFSDGCFAVK